MVQLAVDRDLDGARVERAAARRVRHARRRVAPHVLLIDERRRYRGLEAKLAEQPAAVDKAGPAHAHQRAARLRPARRVQLEDGQPRRRLVERIVRELRLVHLRPQVVLPIQRHLEVNHLGRRLLIPIGR